MNKIKLIMFLVLLSFGMDNVSAQTIEQIADNFTNTQLPALLSIIEMVVYIIGIGFGIKGVLKLKEHTESKGQVKLIIPILYLVGSAMLLALPTVINIAVATTGFGAAGGATQLAPNVSGSVKQY